MSSHFENNTLAIIAKSNQVYLFKLHSLVLLCKHCKIST